MQSLMCLQLSLPKCLRKLYHSPCSVVNCNYSVSINEKTETQETKMLLSLAAHVTISFALPPPRFLFQQLDHAASEVCSSANILQGHIKTFGKQFK